MASIRDGRLFTILPEHMIPLQEIVALEAEFEHSNATIQSIGQTNEGEFIVRAIGSGETFDKFESILLALEKGWDYIPNTRYNDKSKFLGTEGERLELEVTIYAVGFSMHPKFGMRYYYRMSHYRNELVWMTTKKLGLGSYRITGLVKRHKEGMTKETILSHCKVVEKKVSNAEHKHKRSSTKSLR